MGKKAMKQKSQFRTLSALPLLGAVCLLVLCMLGTVLTGAGVYSRVTQRDSETYSQLTAAQYLTTRIRQGDQGGRIRIGMAEGIPVLMLEDKIGGRAYVTYVYCHDGFLRELFTAADNTFSPDAGEALLELESLTFQEDNAIVTAVLTFTDGTQQTMTYYLRSGEEGS